MSQHNGYGGKPNEDNALTDGIRPITLLPPPSTRDASLA